MGGQFLLSILLFVNAVIAESADQIMAAYTSQVDYNDHVSYEALVQKIKSSQTNSLDQALTLLPKEFYQNYVLMYRSRSLQDASPQFPRAIVFGKSSQFIMAFNGHEKQKGFNNLEIIQFREGENRWEFREITFYQDRAPSFSEANPKKCLECHQSPHRENVDPRPNWEPYNFWPGAYASVDSEIRPILKKDYVAYQNGERDYLYGTLSKFLDQDFILVDEQAQEEEFLKKFISSKSAHPRYKWLGEFNLRSPLNLTKSTVILNMRRVARIMKEELGAKFEAYKYTILGLGDYTALTSSAQLKFACGDLYMPGSAHRKHLERTLPVRSIKEKYYVRQKVFGWRHGFAAGVEILFLPLGIQTDDWSMDFKTDGRFAAEDRFTSPHDSHAHFRDAVAKVYEGDPALQMDCEQLKSASEKALNQFEQSGELDRNLNAHLLSSPKPHRPLVQRCISCHVEYEDGGQAPSIPFNDFSRLRTMLMENKYKRGTLFEEILFRTGDHAPLREQMPPAGFTDRKQRDEFIESLQKLLN